MAEGKVLNGKWGYYFPYTDADGNEKGLKILDNVYRDYYSPGYLTDEHIEDMLAGKSITFTIPGGSRDRIISAKIIPYTTKAGRPTQIIKFEEPDKVDDRAILMANAERIATSYWTGIRFDYRKPQEVVDSIEGLTYSWATFATSGNYAGKRYGTIKLYKNKVRKYKQEFFLYCEVDPETSECTLIDENKYNAAVAKDREIRDEQRRIEEEKWAARIALEAKVQAVRDSLLKWVEDIEDKIWVDSGKVTSKDFVIRVEPIVADIDVSKDLIFSSYINNYVSATHYFLEFKDRLRYTVTSENYNNESEIANLKRTFLKKIKVLYYCMKLRSVREEIYKEYETNGLESLVENIDVNTALDIGTFRSAQKIILKHKADAPKHIIYDLFKDVVDEVALKEKILNFLKVYYEFYNFPEKDRKAVAKFIAVHKISEYYDEIQQYDDVMETLIQNSRDPKLLKPMLTSIAGTSRADCIKDTTFYFEKRARLVDKILLYKPIELLDRLRGLLKDFNSTSNVAILTNIELDADESFIFQFYTFADSANDDSGFDGRRMSQLTKLYNSCYASDDTNKIHFAFDGHTSE